MIRTHALTKRYGSLTAVDGIDLDVRSGDIYGFLGANGSGKTTTVRMLLGLVLATSGSIELLDQPMPKQARAVLPQVGALVEGPAAYGHLSGRANLMLYDASGPATRAGRGGRVDEVLEQVGLGRVGRRPVKAYSLGMRQRLGLGAALLRAPRLLVLDEPTNGLDPQGIREIRGLLLDLHRRGTTIFLSSHLLAEVEQLCTRVGVLDRGRLVVQEELSVLQAPTGRTVLRTCDGDAALAVLDGRVQHRDGDRMVVRGDGVSSDADGGAGTSATGATGDGGGAESARINALLVGAGIRVSEIGPERRSLEDIVAERTAGGEDVQRSSSGRRGDRTAASR